MAMEGCYSSISMGNLKFVISSHKHFLPTIVNISIVNKKEKRMNKFFRALIAGWGAKKMGLGCFGTIIVFIIIYYLLGYL